ncbi:MAG: class II fructose-bisphosphate aldolase [Dehalococcoidales bacterium]|nr:class II fructose-bisphosphate aldolase [Dehalococcoidales bacterium]
MSKYSNSAREQPVSGKITPERIDTLVRDAVFATDNQVREGCRRQILEMALAQGIFPASIQGLYEARGKGLYEGITVPAINIRGITYEVARAVFRAALANRVGAFIFEIARSEIGYTAQRPAEFAACVLAAGIREGFHGPIFLQGDHFQVSRTKYNTDPEGEVKAMKDLIHEAVSAGFLNIDIDASTLVNLDKPTLEEQQDKNCQITAEMTKFIRDIEPKGISISIGGEIGEVGRRNSTVEDLRAFMTGYLRRLGLNIKGISKISVQTGTKHGGVVLPDGSIAQVEIDFTTLEELSRVARKEYGMSGAVQHGASTLPEEVFDIFPRVGCTEIHLATGFQNIIYDSPFFPEELRQQIYRHLEKVYHSERAPENTDEQFLYATRKKAFGDFKSELWRLPEDSLTKIKETLQERFSLLFQKLKVVNTVELVRKFVVVNRSLKNI